MRTSRHLDDLIRFRGSTLGQSGCDGGISLTALGEKNMSLGYSECFSTSASSFAKPSPAVLGSEQEKHDGKKRLVFTKMTYYYINLTIEFTNYFSHRNMSCFIIIDQSNLIHDHV